jgi:outer membrane receptor protein involved in Fe transport
MKQFFCLLFLLLTSGVFSQRKITGVIKDEKGEGLPFVSVVIKGTNKGTKSNDLGEYLISVPDSNKVVLKYSFIGYESQEIVIENKTTINITLISSVSLEEVVVVGYGSATKKELTGATSKVGGEDVEKMNLSRMDQALQGQVSGVNVSTNSGSPGGASNIRIRGLSTFGDNDPLILFD